MGASATSSRDFWRLTSGGVVACNKGVGQAGALYSLHPPFQRTRMAFCAATSMRSLYRCWTDTAVCEVRAPLTLVRGAPASCRGAKCRVITVAGGSGGCSGVLILDTGGAPRGEEVTDTRGGALDRAKTSAWPPWREVLSCPGRVSTCASDAASGWPEGASPTLCGKRAVRVTQCGGSAGTGGGAGAS